MISHPHRCVFVHVPKVAGQSVETIFLADLGLDWESRAPLLLRPRMDIDPQDAPPRLAHLRADQYVALNYMSQGLFDCYWAFGMVRNPFSRLLSLYRYLGYAQRMTFPAFVRALAERPEAVREHYFLRPQADYLLGPAGERLVDFVGYFENIAEDFAAICERMGMGRRELPRVNTSGQGAGTDWRAHFDRETAEAAVALYRPDFEAFGYHPAL